MSLIHTLLSQVNAIEISIISLVAFLLFYTMYDKKQKRLIPGNLMKVLTFSQSIDHSLVEINKVVSLSGLSVSCMAFFPVFKSERYGLLWSAMLHLWIHATYSVYKYYGSNNLPYITNFLNFNDQFWKKLSIVLGISAQIVLSAGFWGYISWPMLACFGVTLGLAHFYAMEIDYKLVLRVRPFAYIVFPLALLAIIYGVFVSS